MERKINKIIEEYVTLFKNDIRTKMSELVMNSDIDNHLLNYIYSYERLSINKEELNKRKRVKNMIPNVDRCCAKRANSEQCTRRKRNELYCGTHMKGVPNGEVVSTNEDDNNVPSNKQKTEVWIEDVNGIFYYIDKNKNVYQVEDILSQKTNPKIIGKYTKTDDKYEIQLFP